MAKYKVKDAVIYREDNDANTRTGVIQKLLATDSDGQTYEIKPDEGGSSSTNVTVKESNIVRFKGAAQ